MLTGPSDVLTGLSDVLTGPSDVLTGPSDVLAGPSDVLAGPKSAPAARPWLRRHGLAQAVSATRGDAWGWSVRRESDRGRQFSARPLRVQSARGVPAISTSRQPTVGGAEGRPLGTVARPLGWLSPACGSVNGAGEGWLAAGGRGGPRRPAGPGRAAAGRGPGCRAGRAGRGGPDGPAGGAGGGRGGGSGRAGQIRPGGMLNGSKPTPQDLPWLHKHAPHAYVTKVRTERAICPRMQAKMPNFAHHRPARPPSPAPFPGQTARPGRPAGLRGTARGTALPASAPLPQPRPRPPAFLPRPGRAGRAAGGRGPAGRTGGGSVRAGQIGPGGMLNGPKPTPQDLPWLHKHAPHAYVTKVQMERAICPRMQPKLSDY